MRLLALGLLLLSGEAAAQEALGFAEVRSSFFPGARGDAWQLVERLRPTFEAELAERLKLVATVELRFTQGRRLEEEGERRNSFLGIDELGDYLDVDRLHLDFYAGPVDVRLGRQALNWGSAQFFNPTDPFPEVLLAEPWRPRRGVNAVRATVPFGEANDASLVVGTNDVFDELRAAARVRVNWSGIDFAVIGAWRGDSDNALIGLDLRGTLVVGWWIEAAYLIGPNRHEEIAVGIDYSFPIFERATLFAQYYRNGAGSADPVIAPPLPARSREPFAPFTSGRDYLVAGGSLAVEPELTIAFSLLQNLNDGTGFAVPTINYAVLDWLEVSFSAQVPYSITDEGGEFAPRALAELIPDATLVFWTRASF